MLARIKALKRYAVFSNETFFLGLLILAALVLRLLFVRLVGFDYDTNLHRVWGTSVVEFGLVQSYEKQTEDVLLPNYPPITLLLLGSIRTAQTFFDNNGIFIPSIVWYKLPAIWADLGIMLVVYLTVSKLKNRKFGLMAASIVAFSPAMWFDSSVWGQTDSIYAFFLLASCYFFMERKFFRGGLFLSLSILTKMQAVVFLPVFLFFICYLLKSSKRWYLDILVILFGVVATLLFNFVPFLAHEKLSLLISVYKSSVGFYTATSSNAYNIWWALFADKARDISSTTEIFGPLNLRLIGLLLFLSALVVSIGRAKKPILLTDEKKMWNRIFYLFTVTALAFFVFNTEMHERYLSLFIPVGAIIAVLSEQHRRLYFIISGLYFFNLLGVLPFTSLDINLYKLMPPIDVVTAILLLESSLVFFWRTI